MNAFSGELPAAWQEEACEEWIIVGASIVATALRSARAAYAARQQNASRSYHSAWLTAESCARRAVWSHRHLSTTAFAPWRL